MARTAKLKRLTDMAVRTYAKTGAQSKPLHDGGGLYLRKRDAGAYWYLRLTDPSTGEQQWHRMFPDDPSGHYPHKTLADAREEAGKLWRTRSAGHDPRELRTQTIRQTEENSQQAELERERRLTMRQLFDRWAATELVPHTRADGKRTGRKDGGQYTCEQFERRVFPAIGNVAAAEVSKADVLAILDSAKAEGKLRTANVLLADLKQMMRFAVMRDIIQHSPLESVTKRDAGGTEVGRERVLSADDVATLAVQLPKAGMSQRGQHAVWIVLATGCRIGELMSAQWSHVDLKKATWHLPETKNQRPHTIHLSTFALRHFEALADLREADQTMGDLLPWVFPNTSGKGPVCVKSFGKQLADRQRPADRRLQHRSKATAALMLPGGKWTAHDLRRTAATFMAGLGVSGDVIDECLNHVIESRVRRTYIRNRRPVEQASAFDLLGAKLTELICGRNDRVDDSGKTTRPVLF